jgi:hypothetical protein
VRGVVGHRGDLVQGIQDVQLGDHGSRMAVIDPSYQDAGTRWEDNRSPRDSDGGLILYVGLATRSLAALRPTLSGVFLRRMQALAHTDGQSHRGRGGSAPVTMPGGRRRAEIRRSTMSYLSS